MSNKVISHIGEDYHQTTQLGYLSEGDWFTLEKHSNGNVMSNRLWMKIDRVHPNVVNISSGCSTGLELSTRVYRVSSETKWKYL